RARSRLVHGPDRDLGDPDRMGEEEFDDAGARGPKEPAFEMNRRTVIEGPGTLRVRQERVANELERHVLGVVERLAGLPDPLPNTAPLAEQERQLARSSWSRAGVAIGGARRPPRVPVPGPPPPPR